MPVGSVLGLMMFCNHYLEDRMNTELAKYADDIKLFRLVTAREDFENLSRGSEETR